MVVQNSIIHKSQAVEKIQESISWWMNKCGIHLYDTILLNHKGEWSTDTSYNVDKPWKYA